MIHWTPLDRKYIPETIRIEAEQEYVRMTTPIDRDYEACDRATCPNHRAHRTHAEELVATAETMAWQWAWAMASQ